MKVAIVSGDPENQDRIRTAYETKYQNRLYSLVWDIKIDFSEKSDRISNSENLGDRIMFVGGLSVIIIIFIPLLVHLVIWFFRSIKITRVIGTISFWSLFSSLVFGCANTSWNLGLPSGMFMASSTFFCGYMYA